MKNVFSCIISKGCGQTKVGKKSRIVGCAQGIICFSLKQHNNKRFRLFRCPGTVSEAPSPGPRNSNAPPRHGEGRPGEGNQKTGQVNEFKRSVKKKRLKLRGKKMGFK